MRLLLLFFVILIFQSCYDCECGIVKSVQIEESHMEIYHWGKFPFKTNIDTIRVPTRQIIIGKCCNNSKEFSVNRSMEHRYNPNDTIILKYTENPSR